ncbi:putative Nonspecific lipid-transfer protein [Hibiscus syriacus]|uniref:Non-specific lipid-transfer protein n=2 Tax=Hibiscus syriacus TaxID=106335 RepID=A0A6A2YYJ5_HIBSY|nr:putative Nonspecific lipid-transfer protein [Hibiscus syriacus]
MEKKLVSFSWSLGVLAFIMILAVKSKSVDAMSCEDALTALMPCRPFLTTGVDSPDPPCCQAVATVTASATTTLARRELCRCFEKAGPALGVIPDKAKQLPQKCGISVPVPIDPTINCDT